MQPTQSWEKIKEEKARLQEEEYTSPYHHFVNIYPPRMFEYFAGFEYLVYVKEVIESLPYGTMKRVAEVGCGDGKILFELAKMYPHVQFEGFDTSVRAILFAKGYGYDLPNLSFFAEDFRKAEGVYDAVICVETLEHIPDDEVVSFVETLREKTKKHLVLTVPSSNLPVSAKHFRHYDPELLREHLKGFKMNICYFCQDNWITRWMLQVLVNRFFIVKTHYIINPIFSIYERFFKNADEKTGVHLFAIGEVEK